jgi:RimJ/RimL family protein N-acetyltransferase
MFTPIVTRRLVIRGLRADDAENLHARRNDPDVARYQDWELPYPMEKAVSLVSESIELGGPTDGEWWMAAVCLPDGLVIGDLVVNLTWQGRTAEVGYAFDRAFWGQGYATESLGALVDFLFDDIGVTRVEAMLDPANPASARLLERTGFRYEGRTRLSFWKDDEPSDDLLYGMLRPDREAWLTRRKGPPSRLSLAEVTVDDFRDVASLETHQSQTDFVAPMLWSYADALFPEVVDGAAVTPWMRAVRADDELVAFVMLALSSEHHREPYLWRLLVDRMHQRRGIGSWIVITVAAQCRAWGDTGLLTSWGEGIGSPGPFYEHLGFVPTGRTIDDETEARLDLT